MTNLEFNNLKKGDKVQVITGDSIKTFICYNRKSDKVHLKNENGYRFCKDDFIFNFRLNQG